MSIPIAKKVFIYRKEIFPGVYVGTKLVVGEVNYEVVSIQEATIHDSSYDTNKKSYSVPVKALNFYGDVYRYDAMTLEEYEYYMVLR